ncbi:MAG: universal stress protein [Anaerolineales bacterium]|jgi:nucleotide-binding universal stress UspA family protein
MFQKIVLAVDGSENALRAAGKAGELARALHSEHLWVVVAYDPVPAYLGEPNVQKAMSSRLREAESILQMAIEAVGQIPGEIRKEILEGQPAEEILNVANVRKSDLIVMGSRGLGKLAGIVLGSQSQKVVSHAPCPVLIVR